MFVFIDKNSDIYKYSLSTGINFLKKGLSD